MAQTGTRAARVVGSNIVQIALRAFGLNHAPDDFWAESVFSNPLRFVDDPKYRACGDASSTQPGVECRFHPSRHRNRPHVAARAHHIGDYPMLFSLLEAFERQSSCLCSSKAASHQDGNHSIISFAADTALVQPGKEALALFRGHPVAHPHTMLFHSLNPPAPPQDQDSEARNRQPRMPAGGPPPSGG